MTARKDVGYECYWWLEKHLVASVMEDSGIHKEGNTGLWKGTNIIGAVWPNSHTLKLYVCNNLRWHRTFTGKVVLNVPCFIFTLQKNEDWKPMNICPAELSEGSAPASCICRISLFPLTAAQNDDDDDAGDEGRVWKKGAPESFHKYGKCCSVDVRGAKTDRALVVTM